MGIRAHDLVPAKQGGQSRNTFNIEIIDEIDGPFEKDYIVRTDGDAGSLWWISGRDEAASGVRALSIAPEDILLLEA